MKKFVIFIVFCTVLLSACDTNALADLVTEYPTDANETVPTFQTITDYEVTETTSLTSAQIFEYNADAVFTIYTSSDDRHFNSIGSGFFVCATGIAVTNHHVIASWPYARILTHSGQEFDILGYLSYDVNNDLAIIQVDGSNFPYLVMGDSDSLRIGDNIYAIGSPLGYHNTFSTGIISRFDYAAEFGMYRVYGMIQITAPISGGSSGGALLNTDGHVIGITTAAYSGYAAQALNFAVPISRVYWEAAGSVQPLPIGEEHYITYNDLVGTWAWSRGSYVFNADGSGDRVWDGVAADFEWHIFGMMLVLNFPDGYEGERWLVQITNEDEITIGGAHFTRGEVFAGSYEDATYTIIGTWDWSGGWYTFNADGTGSREWDGVANTFVWGISNGTLNLRFIGAADEQWSVYVINDNEISIGGAAFSRAQ